MNTKLCRTCGLERSLSEFNVHRRSKDGLDSGCKSCIKTRDALRHLQSASAERARVSRSLFDAKMAAGVKWCYACDTEKPRDEFAAHRKVKDGLQSMCKGCRATYYSENSKEELIKRSAYYKQNSEKIKAREAERYASNPEKIKEQVRRYYLKNVGARKAYNATYQIQYRAENQSKIRGWRDAWRAANPHKYNAYWMKRRAAKLLATPSWVDYGKIEEFYFAADFLGMVTGIWHEVDHIVPLQGSVVCGLHVHTNLQVMTRSENRSKGHLRWPDMP